MREGLLDWAFAGQITSAAAIAAPSQELTCANGYRDTWLFNKESDLVIEPSPETRNVSSRRMYIRDYF